MTRRVLAVLGRADRVMLTRMALHGLATAISVLLAFTVARSAPMWQQMALYAISWIMCALAYLPVLFAWESAMDAFDRRVRGIVREEFDRHDLVTYQRELDSTVRREIESAVARRTHTRD
ncbi:MAG: hypothetical protein NVSMB64_18050 [Candidatus Velthaea sp.]